ncbi:MAG: hypothetical protein JWP45_2561 [Mucilaginibacter sp.]|nr:hypothetical protein [Mucilaginibacter sp.]
MKIFLISYLYVVFLALAFLVDFLPFFVIIKSISQLANNSIQTIRSNILEDSEKEKFLLTNAVAMFRQSLKILGFVIVTAILGFLLLSLTMLFNHSNYRLLLNYTVTFGGITVSVLAFFTYFLFKKLYVKIRL